MQYYLGIDIGTTATKTVAFSPAGETLAIESISYPLNHPQPGWSEQDPTEILQAVVNGINKVISALSPAEPSLVSFSSVMHSLLAVDKDGKPLTGSITWADNRAEQIAKDLKANEEGKKFYQLTGVPVHAMSPFCKLLWLRNHRKEIYLQAHKFIGIKEFVFYSLFGEYIIDTSIASATGLLNLSSLQWDADILNYLEIDAGRLSSIVSAKHIFYYKSIDNRLLLSPQMPVIVGASDGACANLGSGAIDSNILAISIGTSSAARLIVRRPLFDDLMRIFCYHVKDDQYIAGGGSNSGGIVFQWLKDNILDSGEEYDELVEQADNVNAGSDGLIFLPYILGERAPLWNGSAKGVFYGLTIQHTKAHLVRSVLEGLIFNLYTISQVLTESNKVDLISASGGLTSNDLVLQIIADVFNSKVVIKSTPETSALGAVIIGMDAIGLKEKLPVHTIKEVLPSNEKHLIYSRSYQKFARLYNILKDEMND
ncbi:MAG: gluconokinase [Candidatus Dadabacteria bacterium]